MYVIQAIVVLLCLTSARAPAAMSIARTELAWQFQLLGMATVTRFNPQSIARQPCTDLPRFEGCIASRWLSTRAN